MSTVTSKRQKRSSSAMLVEVFEDIENRRFAICSKAETEKEFCAEAAEAIAGVENREWVLRLRELLPLVADIVCKYRGYKAETVQERRELVAGDLEMPQE